MLSSTSEADSSILGQATIQQPIALSEFRNMAGSFKLDGGNYLEWLELVNSYIKGKGKLSHLIGPMASKDDWRFVVWDEEDSNNFISLEFNATWGKQHMHEIWESMCHTYGKGSSPNFWTKDRIHNIKSLSIIEYYNVIKSLWLELD